MADMRMISPTQSAFEFLMTLEANAGRRRKQRSKVGGQGMAAVRDRAEVASLEMLATKVE